MSDKWLPEPSVLSVRSGREGAALDAALQRLVPGHLPDRPDAPDLQITAVRRLPAVGARHAPFPEALHSRPPYDPRTRAPHSQQSRHGPFGNPAASSPLGEAVRNPALRRHRRAARVSRSIREPSLQRAAPPPAHLPALRVESGFPVLVGDD